QSLVEMQPAAATDGIDAGARRATPARRMEAAPRRPLRIEWFRERTVVPMSHPRWRVDPAAQRLLIFCVKQKGFQPKFPNTPLSSPRALSPGSNATRVAASGTEPSVTSRSLDIEARLSAGHRAVWHD